MEKARFESGVSTAQKPWTHLKFENDPENFQFAIVSDRTGSPRRGIFEEAITKLNWLKPEFVMSVGDLIQGTSENEKTNAAEWDEFMKMVEPLEMPFFFLAGNHDIQAKNVEGRVGYEDMRNEWEKRFGVAYYYYVYKNTLFLALFSNDGIERSLSDKQVAYFAKILADHNDVRWTLVFLHHPLWDSVHDSNFSEIEALLKDRKYTVFAGHQHRYRHFDREDRNYYVLATTGGGSQLRGTEFGEFDHVTWVTMTDEGPVVANIRLDGLLPHDVTDQRVSEFSSLLSLSASIRSNVLLGGDDTIENGLVYLKLGNRSPYPIRYEGSFFHNHYVHPSPGAINRTVQPMSEEIVEVKLRVLEPFKEEDGALLDFQGTVAYKDPDIPALAMSASRSVRLENTGIDIIKSESVAFVGNARIVIDFVPEDGIVRYTLDGSDPTENSAVYNKPIGIDRTVNLKARFYSNLGIESDVDTVTFTKKRPGRGLLCDYFEYEDNVAYRYALPNFDLMRPTIRQTVATLDPSAAARRNTEFGLVYRGYIDIPESGNYEFHLESDDGARLIIDGKTVIDDGLKHPARVVSGTATLKAGKRSFELQYFQHRQDMRIGLSYTLPSGERKVVPASRFSYDATIR